MKTSLFNYLLRGLCAMVIGFLLAMGPKEITALFVQIIGGLFAFAGLVVATAIFSTRMGSIRYIFPVVGLGCIAFGVFLLVNPDVFVHALMYVLGGTLVLIGAIQVTCLFTYSKVAPLSWTLFIAPLLVAAAGVVVLVKPTDVLKTLFVILGVAFIVYGASEMFLGIRLYRFRRMAARLAAETEVVAIAETAEVIEDAVVVDAEP